MLSAVLPAWKQTCREGSAEGETWIWRIAGLSCYQLLPPQVPSRTSRTPLPTAPSPPHCSGRWRWRCASRPPPLQPEGSARGGFLRRGSGVHGSTTVLGSSNPEPTTIPHPSTADRWPSMMMEDDAVEEAVARLDKIEVGMCRLECHHWPAVDLILMT